MIGLWIGILLCGHFQRVGVRSAPVPPSPIPIVEFFGSLSTAVSGYGRVEPRNVTLTGQKYDQALSTEVANSRAGEQLTVVSLLLNGDFDRFEATVGREEKDASRGPGYVYFEVWGDDRLLVKSDAIGSTRSPGGVSPGPEQPARRGPQDISASVQGVLQLKLVTRYASDLPQRGRNMDHARGCIWAKPQLIPSNAYIGKHAADPVRDALRLASVRVIASTLSHLQQSEPGLRQYPLSLGVAPLKLGDLGNSSSAPEPMVRAAVQELFISSTQQKRVLFRGIDRNGNRYLIDAFPANRVETADNNLLVDSGRKAGAAVVVTGSYSGGPDGRVSLFAVDTRTGWKSPEIEVTIPSLRSEKSLATK